MVAAVSIGILWAAWCAHLHLGDRLAPGMEGRNVTVIGTIEGMPTAGGDSGDGGDGGDSGSGAGSRRFQFHVEKVLSKIAVERSARQAGVPENLSLSWYAAFGKGAPALPLVESGARWQFTVRLTRPHGNANPHGFDYELWLFERHIGATGTVRSGRATPALLHDTFVFSFSALVGRMRAFLKRRILAALPSPSTTHRHAGVIVALVIGEQRAISAADWDNFRSTGVSHLVAISGLHIMMVAGLAGRLMLALWRRSFWLPPLFRSAGRDFVPLPLRMPAQKAEMFAALLAAAGYASMAGFGVPAQRALYMFAVLTVAFWCGRVASAGHILCIAMGLVLLVDPWALLWPGFQLSFATVAIILYAGSGRVRGRAGDPAHAGTAASPSAAAASATWRSGLLQRWRRSGEGGLQALRTQGAVTLGLLPLTMLLFSQYSLVGPAANVLAIPVVTLLVAPLALLGAILPEPLATPVLLAAHGTFSLLSLWLEWLAAMPLAVWRAPLPSWPLFLAALAGTLLMLAPRGWPMRAAGLCGWLPLLCNTATHPAPGMMWVTAFDIGQGMAVLVETAQHRLLYDTGPPYGAHADAGQRVILPYLQARGIGRLDALVVSHADSDHAGGALSLLAALPIDRLYSSLPLDSAIVRQAVHPVRCEAGQYWRWDGIDFDMLHPAGNVYAGDAAAVARAARRERHNKRGSKPDRGDYHARFGGGQRARAPAISGTTNARSCTLRISTTAYAEPLAMLLPGDIGVAQEQMLVRSLPPERLRADVLLAPHHGSKSSSSPALLTAVDPALAIFQVGYRNRYHHPQAGVYSRYGNFGIRRLRTDQTGAIALQFGATLEVGVYREQHARYWQHGGATP